MKKNELREAVRKIIKEELNNDENIMHPTVIKALSDQYIALKRAMDDPNYLSTAYTKSALLKVEDKIKQMCKKDKFKIKFKELIPDLDNILKENQPAPSKPRETPSPTIAPGKPGEKPKPRRPLGNPNVQPKPKASIKEEEMLDKIVARFKSKKSVKEDIKYPGDNKWQEGYKNGYKEGYVDGKLGKNNKFINL